MPLSKTDTTPWSLPALRFEKETPPFARLIAVLFYPLRHLAQRYALETNEDG